MSELKVEENYSPKKKLNCNKDKTIWTEKRLQELQKKLFDLYKECRIVCYGCQDKKCDLCKKRPCSTCKEKLCNIYIYEMEKYLIPYGISIFKRSFKYKATCEEMDRIVSESVGALLLDLWIKKKVIKTSFGAMLKWKMVYFLYGKINLFDSDKVSSLEQITSKMPDSEGDGLSLIEFYDDINKELTNKTDVHTYLDRNNTVDMVVELIKSNIQTYSSYIEPREKYSIFIRAVHAINRFFENKEVNIFFEGKAKHKFYYTKLLDAIKIYLTKQREKKDDK